MALIYNRKENLRLNSFDLIKVFVLFFIQRKTFFAKQSPLMVLGCICILSSNPDVLNSSPPPPPPPPRSTTPPSSLRRGPSRRPCSPTAPQARRPARQWEPRQRP